VCQKILLLIFDSNSLPFSSVEKWNRSIADQLPMRNLYLI
jgi:hypothetical protein